MISSRAGSKTRRLGVDEQALAHHQAARRLGRGPGGEPPQDTVVGGALQSRRHRLKLGGALRCFNGQAAASNSGSRDTSGGTLPCRTTKFDRVTPTRRTPFGGGNTDRISPSCASMQGRPAVDRPGQGLAAGRLLEVGPLDLHRHRARRAAPVFSHQAQTSSAIASTPASMRAGSIRSSSKVVSDPDDLRSRFGLTGR